VTNVPTQTRDQTESRPLAQRSKVAKVSGSLGRDPSQVTLVDLYDVTTKDLQYRCTTAAPDEISTAVASASVNGDNI